MSCDCPLPPPASRSTQRILLLQLKRIGDFILTAPAVAALRARHPQAEIVAVVPASVAELATCFPGLNRVLAYHSPGLNLALWAELLTGKWDACYDFTGTDRAALMTRLSRAAERVGYQKFAANRLRSRAYTRLSAASVRDLHTVDFHLALLAEGNEQPVTQPAEQPVFVLPDNTSAAPPALVPGYVVAHIGTAREEKFWPAERWAEVLRQIIDQYQLRVVLTGTNAGLERPHLDALRTQLASAGLTLSSDARNQPQVLDLTGQLSLIDTARVIASSQLALGVDSMAMHLAAMLGKPQVVLYGPTNPFHWRPRQALAVVLRGGESQAATDFQPKAKGTSMDGIATETVLREVGRVLGDK